MKVNSKCRSTICYAIMALSVSTAAPVSAGQNNGELEGLYHVKRGWAESQEIGASPNPNEALEQIGRYKVALEREGWNQLPSEEKRRIQKTLVISGVFRGRLAGADESGNPLFNHVLGNEDRTGAIYTEGDFLTSVSGFEPCGTDELVAISGIERINPVRGAGIYSHLQEGQVFVNVEVNQCTLQNDLQFIPEGSYLLF